MLYLLCSECSGKAFSKLMKKHKALLRVDLCSNACGFSGVLEMMPRGSNRVAALATSAVCSARHSASSGVLGNAQAVQNGPVLPNNGVATGGIHSAGKDVSKVLATGGDWSGQLQQGSSAAEPLVSDKLRQQEGVRLVKSQKTSRKGLVPMFTPDSQHTAAQTEKENLEEGSSDSPAELLHSGADKAAKAKKAMRPQGSKPAGKAKVHAQHPRQQSTAGIAGFEFEPLAQLQSQPTARLSQFVAPAGASTIEPGQDEEAMATGRSSQRYETGGFGLSSALQNAAWDSATFGDWKSSAEDASQALYQPESVLLDSFAAPKVERPSTAGIADPARRTVSFQQRDLQEDADFRRAEGGNALNLASDFRRAEQGNALDLASDFRRAEQGNALDLASDFRRAEQGNAAELASCPAHRQGTSQAWREFEAEDLGRQRAAADSEKALHHIRVPLADYYAPESATADSSDADLTKASVSSVQQRKHARPSSAHPGGRQSVKQSNVAAVQQGVSHERTGSMAVCEEVIMTGQAILRQPQTRATGVQSAGLSAESCSAAGREGAAVSGSPGQTIAAAAAAMEAAKVNVWKAEAMCEIEGLKCSLKGADVNRQRYIWYCTTRHYSNVFTLHILARSSSHVCAAM